METFLTRAITIVALTCILVVGVAATSILGRDSVPAVSADHAAPVGKNPVSNKKAKVEQAHRRELRAGLLSAQAQQADEGRPANVRAAAPGLCRRRSADLAVPNVTAAPAPAKPKPVAVAKPPVQKNYTLLSRRADRRHQGAAETLGPIRNPTGRSVEKALRAIARKMHSTKQADPAAGMPPIDPELRRSGAAQVGGDAAAVPAARRPEARSPRARPHHRSGTRRRR